MMLRDSSDEEGDFIENDGRTTGHQPVNFLSFI